MVLLLALAVLDIPVMDSHAKILMNVATVILLVILMLIATTLWALLAAPACGDTQEMVEVVWMKMNA